MNTTNLILELDQLEAGDLLVCVIRGSRAQEVAEATGSKYTHAGICYSSTEVVHMTMNGIEKVAVDQFLRATRYAAVLRNPSIWNSANLKLVRDFLDGCLANHRSYDLAALDTFSIRRDDHRLNLLDNLYAHFEKGLKPHDHRKLKYLCSELVVATFVEVGVIHPSAAIVYQCDAYSVGDLVRDPTFGYLVGYLKADGRGEIPPDSEFASSMTFAAWLTSQKQGLAVPTQSEEELSPEEIDFLTEGGRFNQTEPFSE